ncbi:hypothetical protein FRC05_011139 [Tulasnella sp. 425]|nr:hypothetical protein FRC05_011139 [Tulasnella sp. 425]
MEAENALDVAKSHILKAIDQHIAYIHTCRNRAVPIHQLPTEIFTIIVEMDLTWNSYPEADERRLLELVTVSRVWRDIIINSPQVWTNIQARNPLHIAELFIERSKALPLSLTWDTGSQPDLDTNKKFAGLLELVIRNSSRIRSMDVTTGYRSEQTLRRLLGSPTPQLEILRVWARGDVRDYPQFALSERGPLKELSLTSVGLSDWDLRRLSGLRVVDLKNPGIAPSINQILHLLSASPFLEILNLVALKPSSIIPANRSEEIDKEERPIELPYLETIRLAELPPLYRHSILSRIRPGLCNYVVVEDSEDDRANEMLWEELWRERSDTMAALLQLSSSSPLDLVNDWELCIDVAAGQVQIQDVVAGRSDDPRTYFYFGFRDSCRLIEKLGEFFCSLDFPLRPISLRIKKGPIWEQRQPDLCSWSSVLGTLRVEGIRFIRAVYQLLGQQWVMKDGTVTWVCPRLSNVELSYLPYYATDNPEMDGMALLRAVQKRWEGDNGIPALPQPSRFLVRCYPRILPSIKSRAETIKSIIPCFKLTDKY